MAFVEPDFPKFNGEVSPEKLPSYPNRKVYSLPTTVAFKGELLL